MPEVTLYYSVTILLSINAAVYTRLIRSFNKNHLAVIIILIELSFIDNPVSTRSLRGLKKNHLAEIV
jgi:hypothetical protein